LVFFFLPSDCTSYFHFCHVKWNASWMVIYHICTTSILLSTRLVQLIHLACTKKTSALLPRLCYWWKRENSHSTFSSFVRNGALSPLLLHLFHKEKVFFSSFNMIWKKIYWWFCKESFFMLTIECFFIKYSFKKMAEKD